MANSIDERVVALQFENASFKAKIQSTLKDLEALEKSLQLKSAAKGLSELDTAGKNVHLEHIANAVSNIESKFHTLSVVALAALGAVAAKAAMVGSSLLKSLSLDPIIDGLREYETNLNSIQIILSNTQAAGTNIQQVSAALDELNHYADLTIYNFAEMAHNIGTFTAAGVNLNTSVNAIKGIANLAALSGSTSAQASTAMYQLSQAIATGTVRLMDWNSVVNAGMGGAVFQRALAQTAVAMGKLSSGAVQLSGDMQTVKIGGDAFRDSLESGWLTAEVLTTTLSEFTGDLSNAELAAIGFTDSQIEQIQKQAAAAKAAATEVKTLSQLIGTIKESVGSGWAKTWELVFGNFTEAKALWTNVYRVFDGIIGKSSDARNKLLSDWKDLGGRDALLAGISNLAKALASAFEPIKEAFHDIFPPTTGKQLADISKAFENFTAKLMPSKETLQQIGRIATGVFSAIDIGLDIIKNFVRVVFELAGISFKGSGGFVEFLATIADFITGVRNAIKEGNKLHVMFDDIEKMAAVPVKALVALGKAIGDLFGKADAKKAGTDIVNFVDDVSLLGHVADFVSSAWDKLHNILAKVGDFIKPIAEKVIGVIKFISDAIGSMNIDMNTLLNIIQTGGFVALIGMLNKFLNKDTAAAGVISSFKDIVNAITRIGDSITKTFGAMQNALNATALLEIAFAIGLITASAAVLSKLDAEQLSKSLGAIGVMFTQLMLATYALTKMSSSTSVVKMYVIAAALVVLAIAIDVLTIAVKRMADLSWSELIRGLTGVTVLIAGLITAVNFMPDSGKMFSTGIALLALAGAVHILADAVKDLADLSWEEMARGLTGVGALLVALNLFTRFSQTNATGILGGVGIILVAAAIKILASAVSDIAKISWENVGKGLTVIAGALIEIGIALDAIPPTAPLAALGIVMVTGALVTLAKAMKEMSGISWENVGKGMVIIAGALTLIGLALDLIPPTAPLSAAGVLITAEAIVILGKAIDTMGGMSWNSVSKGLITLAVSLGIITAALLVLPGAIPGAIALGIVSAALVVLSGVLLTLGKAPWSQILKGLITLAATFILLGAAGVLLAPVVPVIIGLGLAIALIGTGFAAAGAGIFLLSASLVALSASGVAISGAILGAVKAILTAIPEMATQIAIDLDVLLKILEDASPRIVAFVVKLILQLLDAYDKIIPKAKDVIIKLIDAVIEILKASIPKMYSLGWTILLSILNGINDHIEALTNVAISIILKFIRTIQNNLPAITQAGFDFIIAFINALSHAIDNNSPRMGQAGARLGLAIIRGMVIGIYSGLSSVVSAAASVAASALSSAMHTLGVHSPSTEFASIGRFSILGLALGLLANSDTASNAAQKVGAEVLTALGNVLRDSKHLGIEEIDLTPTIAPVLDLTSVEQGASRLAAMLETKPLIVDASYSSARKTDEGYQDNKDDGSNGNSSSGDTFNFTQNNTSPKALSSAEIYRQTSNQLSTAREVLSSA